MDARNAMQWIVAILVIVGGMSFPIYAGSVYIYSGDFNLRIPAEPNSRGWMNDAAVEIPDRFTIYDLDVSVSLTHTSVFDLQLFLQSPLGTRTCLNMYNFRKEFFKGQDYINTVFDDQAHIPIERAHAPFTGRFRPRSPFQLSAFNDQNTFGQWKLQIYDVYYYDIGNLNSFKLMITIPEPATVILLTLGAGLVTLFKSRRS